MINLRTIPFLTVLHKAYFKNEHGKTQTNPDHLHLLPASLNVTGNLHFRPFSFLKYSPKRGFIPFNLTPWQQLSSVSPEVTP